MRVGWFGGSFDPPHRGHVAVARAAADAFGLGEVLFAPTGRQPLKTEAAGAPFADRLAMVKLVCEEDGRLRASALDGPRADGGANYTVDALRVLRKTMPGAEVFGIVGMDAFLQMSHWREPEQLRELAEWVVVTRPGYDTVKVKGERIQVLESVWMDVSATGLRARLRHGLPCDEWLTEPVLEYVAEHRLYQPMDEAGIRSANGLG